MTSQPLTSPQPFIGPGKTLTDELVIRSIKLVDISYTTTILYTLGFAISKIIDAALGLFDSKAADKNL